jgi:hypothetical protein
MMTCPVCSRQAIGKVGLNQYYCWDCCVEFIRKGEAVEVFSVESDGSLTLVSDSNQQGQEG